MSCRVYLSFCFNKRKKEAYQYKNLVISIGFFHVFFSISQSKAAVALLNASSTVRVVMGPTGTVVTFPEEMGLPSIFNSKPHR